MEEIKVNREDIIRMAIEAELNLYVNDLTEKQYIEVIERFAALVEKAVREKINDEAKAHLQELRNNFDVESTELRLHKWTRGQA